MTTIIYWFLTLFILFLVLWDFFDDQEWDEQINSILIIIPFVLRILLIK